MFVCFRFFFFFSHLKSMLHVHTLTHTAVVIREGIAGQQALIHSSVIIRPVLWPIRPPVKAQH